MSNAKGKVVAEPKYSIGQMVRVQLGGWEAEDLIVHGPIVCCTRRDDKEKHPDDDFVYQVKDEPFHIRESLLIPA